MDEREHSDSVNPSVAAVEVIARGTGAEEEARNLSEALQASGITVRSSPTKTDDRASLGTPEIILTILATSAIKAVATTALKHLEDYLRERARQPKKHLNIQVVVRDRARRNPQRFLLSLQQATEETLMTFAKNVRGAIDHL